MDSEKRLAAKQKNLWISLTGYRTLKVLALLIDKSRTLDELIYFLSEDKITDKSVSKDTIRLTLNTLRAAGCIITRPSKSNNFHYELLSHPFKLNLTDKEFEILLKLQDRLTDNFSWQQILIFNGIFEKIIQLTNNSDLIEKFKNSAFFTNIDLNLLSELSNPQIAGKKVKIKYLSSKYNEEDLDIIPHKISYENNKLYLWCYIFKYKVNNLIDVSKIKKICAVGLEKCEYSENSYDVIYELSGFSMLTFKKKEYETILEKTEDKLRIKASVTNEFWFIQRMLMFGADFVIISPEFFKDKMINKIKQIRKLYGYG